MRISSRESLSFVNSDGSIEMRASAKENKNQESAMVVWLGWRRSDAVRDGGAARVGDGWYWAWLGEDAVLASEVNYRNRMWWWRCN
jgi:hypothetical protein